MISLKQPTNILVHSAGHNNKWKHNIHSQLHGTILITLPLFSFCFPSAQFMSMIFLILWAKLMKIRRQREDGQQRKIGSESSFSFNTSLRSRFHQTLCNAAWLSLMPNYCRINQPAFHTNFAVIRCLECLKGNRLHHLAPPPFSSCWIVAWMVLVFCSSIRFTHSFTSMNWIQLKRRNFLIGNWNECSVSFDDTSNCIIAAEVFR